MASSRIRSWVGKKWNFKSDAVEKKFSLRNRSNLWCRTGPLNELLAARSVGPPQLMTLRVTVYHHGVDTKATLFDRERQDMNGG